MENKNNVNIEQEYNQHMEYIQQEIMKLFPIEENASDTFLGETYNKAKLNIINEIMYTINVSIYGSVTKDIIAINHQMAQTEGNLVETLEKEGTKTVEKETK